MGVEVYPLHWLQAGVISVGLAPVASALARYGDPLGFAAGLVLLLLAPRRADRLRRAAAYGLVAGLVALLLADVIAGAFVRPRPPTLAPALLQALAPLPTTSSFPSRTASFLFAFAGGLSAGGEDAAVLAGLFALLASISEMAAGLAFPSDALGGLVLGVSAAAAVLIGRELLDAPLQVVLRIGGWGTSIPKRRRER